ncbi:MAG TPA: hypothetical protein PK821_04835 [Victivallales bacterium]|nr:hypothetical protein [Victivallales bacterium]
MELIPLEFSQQMSEIFVIPDAQPLGEDYLRIIGIFNEKNFSIPDIKNISVEDSLGRKYPLTLSSEGMLSEFDEIVSFWFSFDVSRQYIDDGGLLFLVWGPDVISENRILDKIGINPESKSRARTFSWKREQKSDKDANFANIEVIADSRADYFFLWYLLPMAVIFIILAFRKKTEPS